MLVLVFVVFACNLFAENNTAKNDSLEIIKQSLIENLLHKMETYHPQIDSFPKKLDNLTKEGKGEYYYHADYVNFPESFESTSFLLNTTDASVTWGRVKEGYNSPVYFPYTSYGSYQLYCAGVGYLNDGTTPQ